MPSRIIASLLWLGSASVLAQIVSWVSTLFVIRLLSPDDYGLMAMATLSIGFLMVLGDFGVGVVVVQAPTLDRPRLRALFGACLLTHLAGAALVFLAAPLVAAFFGDPRLVTLVRVLSLCFIFAGVYALPLALIARTLQFDRKAKVDVLAAVVSAIVAVSLAATGWGVWALVATLLVMHAFRAVAYQIIHPCLFLPFPALIELRDSVRFAGWVTLDRAVWFSYTNLDVAIAGRVLGGTMLGVYAVALSVAAIPLDKVMSIINEISLSAFARIQSDSELVRRAMLRALESVSLLAFPTFLGMAAVAPEMIEVLLGARWAVAVLPLQILCLVFPFRALGLLFAPALFGSGCPRVVVENNILTVACLAVALGIGVQWGVVGLCVGWVVGYVPAFCVAAHRTLTVLGIPARPIVGTVAFSLAAAGTMAAVVIVTRTLVDERWPPLAVLAVLVPVGAGVYTAAVAIFKPATVRVVWDLGVVQSPRIHARPGRNP
jgi:teichuronic acid exporter